MRDTSANGEYSDDDYEVAKAILETAHVQSNILRRIDELEVLHRTTLDEIRRWQIQSTDRFIEIMDKRQREEIERLMAIMKISTANETADDLRKSSTADNRSYQSSMIPSMQFGPTQVPAANRMNSPRICFNNDNMQNQLLNQLVEQQMQQMVAGQNHRAMAPIYNPLQYGVPSAGMHAGLPVAAALPQSLVPALMSQPSVTYAWNQLTAAPVLTTPQPLFNFPVVSVPASSYAPPVSVAMPAPKPLSSIPTPLMQKVPIANVSEWSPAKLPGTTVGSSSSSTTVVQSKPLLTPKTESVAHSTAQNLSFNANKSFTTSSGDFAFPFVASPENLFTKTAQAPRLSTPKSPIVDVTGDDDDAPEHFEPSVHFEPVIPLPDIVDQATGEENETVKFAERCRLYRFVGTEFKERGVGVLKILEMPVTKICRIVMRRDQILKVCANHTIQQTMTLTPLQKSDRAFVWLAHDFSEGEECVEKFAVRFKSTEIAKQFEAAFNAAARNAASTDEHKGNKIVATPTKGFGDTFKPSAGSWVCVACYVSNAANTHSCVCCGWTIDGAVVSTQQSNIFASKPTSTVAPLTGSGFSFGFNANTSSTTTAATSIKASSAKTTIAPTFGFSMSSSTTTSGISVSDSGPKSVPFSPLSANSTPEVVEISDTENKQIAMTTPTTASVPTFSFVPRTTPGGTPVIASPLQNMPSFSFKSTQGDKSSGSLFASPLAFGNSSLTPASVKGDSPTPMVTPSAKSSLFGSSLFGSANSSKDGSANEGKVSGFAALAAKAKTETSVQESSAGKAITPFGGGKFNSSGNSIFSPKNADAIKKPQEDNRDENSDADDEFVPTADFQPVIPLPSLVEVTTGEEEEKVMFESRAKLFRFTDGEYKERGVGVLKVLYNITTKKCRCVMRRDQVLKVCANFPLSEGMKIEKKPNTGNACIWVCQDHSEILGGKKECLVAKFKDNALADAYVGAYRKAVARQFTEKDAIVKEKDCVESDKAPSDGDKRGGSGKIKECDTQNRFDAYIKISDAFASPLKSSTVLEFAGSIVLYLGNNLMHLNVFDAAGVEVFSHVIGVDDSLEAKEKKGLKFISVSEKSVSKQLSFNFDRAEDCQKAAENFNEGMRLAKESDADQ